LYCRIIESQFKSIEPHVVKEMLDLLHKTAVDELNMLDNLVEWARVKYASEAFSPTKIAPFHMYKRFESLEKSASK
jgi:two-component system CheB/CheR fusion protein